MSEAGKRVKEIRTELKMTQDEFGARIGIKKSSLSQIENGKNALTQQNIVAICKVFNVNEPWLRTGEGDPFVKVSREEELQRLIDESMKEESGEIRRRFATAVMRLTPEQIRRCTEWAKETFNLVDAPSADQDPEERELTIDEKVEDYRRQLEAEADSDKSGALPPGKEA